MSVMDKQTTWMQAAIANAESFASPAWLKSWQLHNANAFLQQGMPTRHDENWKYTSVNELLQHEYELAVEASSLPSAFWGTDGQNTFDAYRIAITNGVWNPALSSIKELPAGITVLPLKEALVSYADRVRPILEKNTLATQFGALNAALLSQGVFIYIEAGARIEKPLHIVHYHSDSDKPVMTHCRNIVIAEKGCDVTLFEHYLGADQAQYFNNIVTMLEAREGARINYYKLQQESSAAFHIANIHINQARDSRVNVYQIALGAKLARDDVQVSLNESNAECELHGLYHTRDKQHVDHHLQIDHWVPHCASRQNYKGILEDASRAVFNGKVVVKPDAQKTRALQSNKNLLLSSQAEIDTKPELEIYADDVVCAHGATIGQLDKEALFYLRSRGIDEATAAHILTCGFAADLLAELKDESLRAYIQKQVTQRFANHLCLGECQ